MAGQGFYIELDKSRHTFVPGETITGKVKLYNDKQTKIKGISILFEGNASVYFTTTTRDEQGKKRISAHHRAKEDYFIWKIMLYGNDVDDIILKAGELSLPFRFTLLSNIPSSLEEDYGSINYSMETKMKFGLKSKTDLNFKLPFKICGVLDLSGLHLMITPKTQSRRKNVCSFWPLFWCESSAVGCEITLPRGGFVRGEFASFKGTFYNHSSNYVNQVKVSLVRTRSFHATDEIRETSSIVCTAFSSTGIPEGEEFIWDGEEALRIPLVPPSNFDVCKIIDTQYHLKFEMEISGAFSNLKTWIPITIGTAPLSASVVAQPSGNIAPTHSQHIAIPMPIPSTGPVHHPALGGSGAGDHVLQTGERMLDPELPPPSYDETVKDNPSKDAQSKPEGPGLHMDSSVAPRAPPESDVFLNGRWL